MTLKIWELHLLDVQISTLRPKERVCMGKGPSQFSRLCALANGLSLHEARKEDFRELPQSPQKLTAFCARTRVASPRLLSLIGGGAIVEGVLQMISFLQTIPWRHICV